ncbi:tetratricopeptide repeat protein [Roseateles sp. L2-2]|uniref:tetratricopeptide repeat protein n=1 Tax=Roseateles sp. L2-2 TaxID=3422597 RepID=UPI003D368B02
MQHVLWTRAAVSSALYVGTWAVAAPTSSQAPTVATEISQGLSVAKQFLDTSFSIASQLFLLIALGFLAWIFIREWRRDSLVIEPFDVPKDLQDVGLTGTVLSQLISDHVAILQRTARIDDDEFDINFVELPKLQVDLQLPGIALSLRSAIRYLRQLLGRHDNRLLGEVLKREDGYAIRLRLSSGRARDVSTRFSSIESLEPALKAAAELAITLSNPLEAASIFFGEESRSNNFSKTLDALKLHLSSTPAATHQDAYVLWASIHRRLGEEVEMDNKLRHARQVGPPTWRGQARGAMGPRLCIFLGGLLRERQDLDGALRHFQLAAAAQPSRNVSALASIGFVYLDRNDLEAAKLWFRKAIECRPNSSRGYRGLALVAGRNSDFTDALYWIDRAIDLTPRSCWPRLNRIEFLRSTREDARVIHELEVLKTIDPSFGPLYRAWGDHLLGQYQFVEAVDMYEQAIRLMPRDIGSHGRRAEALLEMGRLADARQGIDALLSIAPKHPDALLAAHSVLSRVQEATVANDCINRAHQIAPWNLWATCRISGALLMAGRLREAMAQLDALPKSIQSRPDVMISRARIHRAAGNPGTALWFTQQASKLAPYHSGFHAERVRSLVDFGRRTSALQIAREFCKRWPQDLEGWRARANVHRARESNLPLRHERSMLAAGLAIEKALKLHPLHAWTRLDCADLLQRKGHIDEAHAILDSVVRTHPFLGAAYIYRAQAILASGGDDSDVETLFRKAVACDAPGAWHAYLTNMARTDGSRALLFARDASAACPQSPMFVDILIQLIEKIKGRSDAIAECILRARTFPPEFSSGLKIRLAELYRGEKQYFAMWRTANDILERFPRHFLALMTAGDAAIRNNEFALARSHFSIAQQVNPESPMPSIGLAECIGQHEMQRALELLAEIERHFALRQDVKAGINAARARLERRNQKAIEPSKS